MNPPVPSKKNGAIIVIVMSILVAFMLMVSALLQLGSFNEVETIHQLRNTQAHWIAEAGLERALSWVIASQDYRNSLPDTLVSTEIFLAGLGYYRVQVSSTPISAVVHKYTIISTGIVSNNTVATTAIVQLTLDAAPGNQGALRALGGESEISANVDVYGTIYQEPPGTLSVAANVTITDIVDAEGGIEGSGADNVSQGDLPNVEPPALDRSPYMSLLAEAATYPSEDLIFDGLNAFTNNLSATTNFIHGDLIVKTDLPSSRTLVATGSITFDDSGLIIKSGAKIVAGGDVKFKNHALFETQTEVFTLADIIFSTQGATATGTTLLALGDLVAKNINFEGIIYAEGTVEVSSGSDITGTLIAGEGFDIDSGVTITYDPSVFADPNPLDFGDSLAIQLGTWVWEELPSP